MKLSRRVALVTGGGRGIGRAIAVGYAREGAAVLVAARSEGEIDATAGEIREHGGRAVGLTADVRRVGDIARMVETALHEFNQIDILVNNAGVPGPIGLLTEIDDADWEETLAINLTGMYRCCKAVLPHMLERKRGNIINISSGAGLKQPRERVRSVPYAVSKFGVEGLTDALAIQLRPSGINVNSLLPGQIHTRFHEATPPAYIYGKLGDPGDVVPAAIYLAALAPGELTGQTISAREFRS